MSKIIFIEGCITGAIVTLSVVAAALLVLWIVCKGKEDDDR